MTLLISCTETNWENLFFFFNDTATTEIYTLSLHDALPISMATVARRIGEKNPDRLHGRPRGAVGIRSEEHTSELQSQSNLVCRLLLEKKKQQSEMVRLRERPRGPDYAWAHGRNPQDGIGGH